MVVISQRGRGDGGQYSSSPRQRIPYAAPGPTPRTSVLINIVRGGCPSFGPESNMVRDSCSMISIYGDMHHHIW